MIVQNKKQNLELFKNGAYGNYVKTWTALEWTEQSGYDTYMVRYNGPNGNGPISPNLTSKQVFPSIEKLIKEIPIENIYVNEMTPDCHIWHQGEFWMSERGPLYYFSLEKTHMRDALKKSSRTIECSSAICYLKQTMDPESYDIFSNIREEFIDHIIELSVYKVNVGQMKRNTMIWEVRSY